MAEVELIYLPDGDGGHKQGVDDFLASGNSVEDLLALATSELRDPPTEEEDEAPPIPYRETPYGLVQDKHTKDGLIPSPLTNFTARIIGDLVEDDGAEEKRSFEIEADLKGRHTTFAVPAERFAGMGWPADHLGAEAIVYAGFGLKDHARAAIQRLSDEIQTRRIYAHTGWRRIGEEWGYLHAGGAIGSLGSLTGTETSLGEGRLGDYSLPDPPTDEGLLRALEASLRFLELVSPTITVPLFAAIYRAPLGEMVPVDLSVFLAGPTGTRKTELTAMAQAHYGAAFNGRRLPANWTSTENALEKQSFAAKDAVLVVDDFAPTGTSNDVARLHRVADRLLRAQGNRSGRSRMHADTTLRAEYYPRGLILSSGEDVPKGYSLRARMLVLELSPGEVNLDVLTEMQRAAAEGLLASAMSAYVRWLAPSMEQLKERLPARQVKLRTGAVGVGSHTRTPESVASLLLGLESFLEFAVEAGAITEPRAERLGDEGRKALMEAAAEQAEHQLSEEPTRRFLELLTAALVAGNAHLADANTDDEPEDASRWGWRPNAEGDMQPRGERIGWLDEDGSLLLEPGAAFSAAQQMARKQGTVLSITETRLWKRMAENDLLASRDVGRSRNRTRVTIAGERMTVVHLVSGILSPENGPNGPNGPRPPGKGHSGPKVGAVSAPTPQETTRDNGPEAAETGTSGPKGPLGPFPEGGDAERVGRGAHLLPDVEAPLINTEIGVQDLIPQLREADVVALDVETTGLNPRRDKVRLLSLATERGTWVIDCFEVDPRPLFPVLAQKKLLIHNALFDLGMLREMGFEQGENGEIIDTMLLSQLLRGPYPKVKENQ